MIRWGAIVALLVASVAGTCFSLRFLAELPDPAAANSDSAYIARFEEHRDAFETIGELLAGVPKDYVVELTRKVQIYREDSGQIYADASDGVIAMLDEEALERAHREIGATFLSRRSAVGEPSIIVKVGWRKPKYYFWQDPPLARSVFHSDLDEIASRPNRPRGPIFRPLRSGWYLAQSDPRDLDD